MTLSVTVETWNMLVCLNVFVTAGFYWHFTMTLSMSLVKYGRH